MLAKEILPWQEDIWQHLINMDQRQRLPHALLFIGIAGVGKKDLALHFAKYLLCFTPTEFKQACNTCHACRLFDADSHPDLYILEPEADSQIIKIDQIRACINDLQQTSQQGKYSIAIINPATAMNAAAANALLKTLEEPAAKVLLMLLSTPGLRIPATILSRCQKVFFPKPAEVVVYPWLEKQIKDKSLNLSHLLHLAKGSPLQVLTWIKNDFIKQRLAFITDFLGLVQQKKSPIELANKWQANDALFSVDLLLSLILDFFKIKLNNIDSIENADFAKELSFVCQTLSFQALNFHLEKIQQARKFLLEQINMNKQLFLEQIFISWVPL